MTEIHIFKKDDDAALNEYLAGSLKKRGDVQLIQHGSVSIQSNDQLHGLPPLDSLPQQINLVAPEPRQGEEPKWLHFKQSDGICWTSDLVALIAT